MLDHGHVDGLVVVALAFLACGFLVKAAIVPFHLWLADAYAVAPTAICIVLAGAMSELGVLGIVRIVFGVFGGPVAAHADAVRIVLVVAGLATAVLGAVMALRPGPPQAHAGVHHDRPCRAVPDGCRGVGERRASARSPCTSSPTAARRRRCSPASGSCSGGSGTSASPSCAARAARCRSRAQHSSRAALLGTGLPLFGPFLGKALLDDALVHSVGWWAVAIAIGATALTGATLLRAAGAVFLGWGADEESERDGYEPLSEPQPSTPVRMWAPVAVLLGGAIAIGLVPGVRHAAHVAGTQATAHGTIVHTVLGGATAPSVHGQLPAPPGHDWLISALTVALAIAPRGLHARPPARRPALAAAASPAAPSTPCTRSTPAASATTSRSSAPARRSSAAPSRWPSTENEGTVP